MMSYDEKINLACRETSPRYPASLKTWGSRQTIMQKNILANTRHYNFPIDNISQGIYHYKVRSSLGKSYSGNLIIE